MNVELSGFFDMCKYPGAYITFTSVFGSTVGCQTLKKEMYLKMNLDAHLISLLSR